MHVDDIAHLFKYDIEAARVAAFIIEPVQGEGGFTVAPPEFMSALKKICDEHGILLIADEVQSGFARTGKFFAMEHYDDPCRHYYGGEITRRWFALGRGSGA